MFIYIISDGTSVKIGISKTPEKRLKQLQTGHPKKLILCKVREVPDDRAKKLENIIHRTCGHYRLKGEWFSMSLPLAESMVHDVLLRTDELKNLDNYFILN
jgi:hypothetical protein